MYTRNSEEVASNAEQSTTVLPPDRDSIVRSLTSLIESPSQPGHSHPPSSAPSPSVVQTQPHASPAQLEALYAAASSGDLVLLKKLFWTAVERGELEAFALANDASSRTGFTPLHVAASRGFLDITQWRRFDVTVPNTSNVIDYAAVIEECGAMPDLEDREGEVRHTCLYIYIRTAFLNLCRPLCTRPPCTVICRSSNICCHIKQRFMHATQMDGLPSTTLVPR